MTSDLALKPHWRSAIDNLLRAHVPHCDVWAYGSRVTGENHEASDLDLPRRWSRSALLSALSARPSASPTFPSSWRFAIGRAFPNPSTMR